jgi:hypothetical protein
MREYSKKIDTAAVRIVDDGVVVDAWGDITKNFQCHSMRKSIMSAIIGVHNDALQILFQRFLLNRAVDLFRLDSLCHGFMHVAIKDEINAKGS